MRAIESVPLPGDVPLFPLWRTPVSDTLTVTADLLADPWADVIDPPFGDVERIGLVAPDGGVPSVALLVRLEDGRPIVAMLSLALYAKASTALLKARAVTS